MFILCPDALSLNGSVMINQSINHNLLSNLNGKSNAIVALSTVLSIPTI